MLKLNFYAFLILMTASLLLAMGIYSHLAWNALFSGLAVLFLILCVRAFMQRSQSPCEPDCDQQDPYIVEKQIYLVAGPYVSQWFSTQRKEMLQHPVTGALWIGAVTQGDIVRQLSQLKAAQEHLKVTLFFPFFPDGHDTAALAIESLRAWQKVLQSIVVAEPLPCIFALYFRCSEERFVHDPDRAIWQETLTGEQTLSMMSVENLICQNEDESAFLTQRKAMLLMLWQWMNEEQILLSLNATLTHASSCLTRVMVADYGTGFNRHGAWSRWLEDNFAILPALTNSKIYPPLPAFPATVILPTVRSIPAPPPPVPHSPTVGLVFTATLLIAASMLYARYHEQQRADDLTGTITSLRDVPAENITQTFTLIDKLGVQRSSLETCSAHLFFQNWGFSQCGGLLDIADKQLDEYSHWTVFSSASSASLFAPGSAVIMPGREDRLQPIVTLIEKNPTISFLIVGHTDNSGDEKNNLLLSEQRAREVRDWLLHHTHAAEQRFVLKGEGDSYPLASNLTQAGREMNRRIEVYPLHPTPINVNEHNF
jgi:outer membrane protein OmpA-like peptidoglycan-associated protein